MTLEDDVVRRLETQAQRTGRTFKDVLNDAVRRGLDEALRPTSTRFRVEDRDMGALPGVEFDDIAGLLDQLEGPEHG